MSSPATLAPRPVPTRDRPPNRLRTIGIAVALVGLYLLSIISAANEAARRSVTLELPAHGADHLFISVTVVNVDFLRSEMTTRLSFQLAGQLARDEVTPDVNLHLLLNTVRGQQEFDFPKGKRINSIEAVFPLQGEVNLYPFDRHRGVIWLLVTVPGQTDSAPQTVVPAGLMGSQGLPLGASLEKRVQVDTRAVFSAGIPGISFRGSKPVQSATTMKGLTGIEVSLTRSLEVIFISIVTMLMMSALAIGMVAMTFKILNGSRRLETYHVPVAVSLIFGLPALRNVQPAVPPPGTFGDILAFTWAETAVAGSAIALIVHFVAHRFPQRAK